MTIVPGGTAFVPTSSKLDDLKYLVDELYNWVEATMLPDVLALAPYYTDALNWGKGCGRYIAWGVFENKSMLLNERYMPAGVLQDGLKLEDVDTSKIAEYVGHSWYKGEETRQAPDYTTEPEYTEYYKDGLGYSQRPLLLGQVPGLRRQADGGGLAFPYPRCIQAQRALHREARRRGARGARRAGQPECARSTLVVPASARSRRSTSQAS